MIAVQKNCHAVTSLGYWHGITPAQTDRKYCTQRQSSYLSWKRWTRLFQEFSSSLALYYSLPVACCYSRAKQGSQRTQCHWTPSSAHNIQSTQKAIYQTYFSPHNTISKTKRNEHNAEKTHVQWVVSAVLSSSTFPNGKLRAPSLQSVHS